VTDETLPGHTAQSGRIIERTNSAQPMYFSEKIGRDYGNPGGGWTEHRDQATVMDAAKAQRLMETALVQMAPYCQVVAA
jgi:hypothetical protein